MLHSISSGGLAACGVLSQGERMNARTEVLLYELMWMGGQLITPTYRSLTESFDDWARRTGLERRIARLQLKGLAERESPDEFSPRRFLRLTEEGAAVARRGLDDPASRWGRAWDGHWRLVLFDVPVERKSLRMQLWRFLRANRFGYLQNSAWVTPDSAETLRERLSSERVQAGSLILLQATPCGGESDRDIVDEGWNFTAINEGYRNYENVLAKMPGKKAGFDTWSKWARQERTAWLKAAGADPFLPKELLPKDYAGKRAWERRRTALGAE
jgi:DNA-binding transcriptional regulator PaaX